MPHYDLVVIGSGPAGEKGAAQAAYFGKRVALIEKEPWLGGAGVNTGTVPSKTLRETALYFSGLQQPCRLHLGQVPSVRDQELVRHYEFREPSRKVHQAPAMRDDPDREGCGRG